MSIWRVLSVIAGARRVRRCLRLSSSWDAAGIPWLPLVGIVVSVIAVTCGAVQAASVGIFGQTGIGSECPILSTIGVWAGSADGLPHSSP